MERKRSKKRSINVLLTKLSPDLQRQIKKPLLKKSSPLRLSRLKQVTNKEENNELLNSIEGEHLLSLKPTLERPASKETESSVVKDNQTTSNDNRFETTFGFSHGVESSNNGGVLVRKTPQYRGLSKLQQQETALKEKEKKQMQICFSIASKASTIAPNVLNDSSYNMIANMEHGYDANTRSPLNQQQQLNRDLKMKTLAAPPSDLTNHLRIMDELGASMRETPISIHDSVELKPNFTPSLPNDLPQRSVLSNRKTDGPIQLISYLAAVQKKKLGSDQQIVQPYSPTNFKQHQMMMKKLYFEQRQKIEQASSQNLDSHNQTKQQFSAKIPGFGSPQNPMYQTVGEFGKVEQVLSKQIPLSEFEVKRRSLFHNASPTKSKLPNIVSFGKDEEVDGTVSQQTLLPKQSRPNLNNPLLPVQLSNKIQVLFAKESNEFEKKIQLPPKTTIAVFDEKDKTLKEAEEPTRPMPHENHVPKWTKVNNHFSQKSKSVSQPKSTGLRTSGTQNIKGRRNTRGGLSLAITSTERNPPNFLLTSSSCLNKTKEDLFNQRTKAHFVSNYNVPAQPFTLPDGTTVQNNQLKNTFQRFKRELRETNKSLEGSPGAGGYEERHLKTQQSEWNKQSFLTAQTLNSTWQDNTTSSYNNDPYRLADIEREALLSAVKHLQAQKRTQIKEFYKVRNLPMSPRAAAMQQNSEIVKATHILSSDRSHVTVMNTRVPNLNKTMSPSKSSEKSTKLSFAHLKAQHQKRGTFYASDLNSAPVAAPAFMTLPASKHGPNNNLAVDLSTKVLPEIVDSPSKGHQHKALHGSLQQSQIDANAFRESNSPSFTFQRRSRNERADRSSIDKGSKLLKSIERASPKNLKIFLASTIQEQQDRKWNNSDLKIKGKNMGFPDHLKNMTFAQHQAFMEMTEEEDAQMKAIFNKDGPQQGVNQACGNSPLESQKDLNADLMMQNIYRSEEFLISPAAAPHISLKGIQTEISEHDGRETIQDLQKSIDTVRKKQLDEKSEDEEGHSPPVSVKQHQVHQVTPLSQTGEADKQMSLSQLGKKPAKTTTQSSIKEIQNLPLMGELDVETNYLKSSIQNFGDELHLKTVFQKRAAGPIQATAEGDVVKEAVIEEQRNDTSNID